MPTPSPPAPATPPPSTSSTQDQQPQQPQENHDQPPNPLLTQYSTKRALIASIEASKRAIESIEQQESDIRKQLENKRLEKKINLKLWEKHRLDTEAAGEDGVKG